MTGDARAAEVARALATLDPFASGTANGRALAPEQRRGLLALLGAQRAAMPDGLIGRPAELPPGQWHLQGLDGASGDRRRYHARWLAHLLAPGEDDRLPLVSIVIPVYNRHAMAVEAVESCLRQSYRATEVIVVDDGSTDRLGESLRPFGGAIRVLTQPNRGVAAARNAGIAAARGEFIHFLDSDNLLDPRCVELKVRAFAAVPDAELCYSAFDEVDPEGRPRDSSAPAPDGGAECATSDLMRATCTGYPFIVSTVMLPAWVCRATGGFEEDLRIHEDRRYWFQLGFRATKAVGYDKRLALRRRTADSLTATRRRTDPSRRIVALRNLLDLLGEPEHWCCVPQAFGRALSIGALVGDQPELGSLRERLDVELRRLGDGRSGTGLSPLPMLLACRLALDEAAWLLKLKSRRGDRAPAALARTLDHALIHACALTYGDAAYWNRCGARPGEGPLPARLRGLAAPSRETDTALDTLTDAARGRARDGRIAAWYAPGRPALASACRQWSRWRVLRLRLAQRLGFLTAARRRPHAR